ncbi:MAG: hypothetical protein ACLFQA_08590 [Bacteroidales bacterium]
MPDTESFQLPQELLVVGAAVQAGIFEALKNRPLTLKSLAAETSSDQRALWTVIEALAALGYIKNESGKFELTSACFLFSAVNFTDKIER